MKKYLPLLIVLLVTLSLGVVKLSNVLAQNSDAVTSDYALDVAAGEKDTANDADAQNNQQDVNQSEEVSAAADDGDPSTELIVAALDEMVAPEEAQESAKLVENPEATTSENDNGEVLKDQSIQTPQEKPNEDVNTQDDNKAPVVDPQTNPQVAPAEQLLENLQNVEPAGQDQQTNEQPATSNDQAPQSGNSSEGSENNQ